jgi:hypothetical protein
MPFREAVYAGGGTDAALLDNLLQVEGIDTIVTADKRFARIGPHVGASVYVLDPAHLERARDIVERYRRNEPLKDPRSYRSWRCRACNELVEGQFDICWKCSTSSPSQDAPAEPPRDMPRDAARDTARDTARETIVMVVFVLAALIVMFASAGRRRVGAVPPRALPVAGQR